MSVPGNPGQELQATTRRHNSYTYRAILQFRSWKILNLICEKKNLHYREWWWILILYKIVIYFYHQAKHQKLIWLKFLLVVVEVSNQDYPIYAQVPDTSFSCDGRVEGGYYAGKRDSDKKKIE